MPDEPITTKDPRYIEARAKLENPDAILSTKDLEAILGYSHLTIIKMVDELGAIKDRFRNAYVWPVNAVREHLGLPKI